MALPALPPDQHRCNGFGCPHDKDVCRRYLDRDRNVTTDTDWILKIATRRGKCVSFYPLPGAGPKINGAH